MGLLRTAWLCLLVCACGKVDHGDADSGVSFDAPGDVEADAQRPLPTEPPVSNGQSAELVLGAPDFATPATGGGPADDEFGYATGMTSDQERLWVVDLFNARALQFNSQPLVNQAAADLVIGQDSFTEEVAGPDKLHLTLPEVPLGGARGDVASDGQVLVVADGEANRVVIWNSLPPSNGVQWDIVLGQTTTTGRAAGLGADRLSGPMGVWTDGETLVVADSGNNRVLIWNSIPTEDGAAADVVLGQADFDSAAAPDPPTPRSKNTPVDVFFDGERLYVSDHQNSRVMGWNGMPGENHAPADFFVGQNSGASGTANAGAGPQEENAFGVHLPGEITVAHGSLYIVDQVNFRVVVHTPRPTESGEAADAVLGWASLEGAELSDPDQAFTPRGVAVFGDKLFLADSNPAFGTSRILRYQLSNLP